MSDRDVTAQPEGKAETKPKKRGTNLLVIVASVAIVAVIIIAAILLSGFGLPRHNISGYGETLFTSFHSSSGEIIDTDTTSFLVPSNDQYRVGGQIKWDESFHNPGTGVLNITSISCTTPGFTFVSSSPSLPVTLPNTATKEEGAIVLSLTFDAPSTPYSGPLNYTIFYDHFA